MARKRKSSTTASGALPNNLTIPYSPQLRRLLTRLSKDSLLQLAFRWLDTTTVDLSPLDDGGGGEEEEVEMYTVRAIYQSYQQSKRVRVKEVVERIVEHEWRGGLSLLQIAEADYQHLVDHPSSHKWTSATLTPITTSTSPSSPPYFHPPTFAHSLQSLLYPMITPHYYTTHHPTLPLTLLRLQLHTPPSHTHNLSYPPPQRIIWLAFPQSSLSIFHTTGTGPDRLREAVRQSIADAVSRVGERFELKSGGVVARTLQAVAFYRGNGGGEGGMVGGWSVYLDGGVDGGVFDGGVGGAAAVAVAAVGGDVATDKRRRIAEGRFGTGAVEGDGVGLENVEFRLDERFPGDGDEGEGEEEEFRPKVTVRFEGSHVFAGVRTMLERGVAFDGLKMPGWVTGEEGATVGTIRDGRLVKRKGL